jgi:hypothetical protein
MDNVGDAKNIMGKDSTEILSIMPAYETDRAYACAEN